MNIKKIIISSAIVLSIASHSAFALSVMPVEKDFVPVSGNATYSFDETAIKNNVDSKKHGLYKIECSKSAIQTSLGIKDTRVFSVGLEKDSMDWTYDIKNCSLYGNNNIFDYSNQKTLTKSEALKIANDFYAKYIKTDSALYNKVGAPVITFRNYGPIMYTKGMGAPIDASTEDIEVDTDNVTDIEKEYTSFTVTYPFLIGNTEVYGNYGNAYGISMEVYKSGVASISVPLLKFKLVKKNSTLMTSDEVSKFIQKGANSPYYGSDKSISLKTFKNVYVISNIYSNNKSDNYLSTGIGLFSDTETNIGSNETYKQVISDYKVGNNNVY